MDDGETPLVVKDHRTGRIISVDGFFEANKTHRRFCLLFLALGFVGGVFAEIGYAFGPDGCDDDGIFETLGVSLFWISALGIPLNGLIFLMSIPNKEMSTADVFFVTLGYTIVVIVISGVFADGILQDMFCSGGPHYDIGAGF